MFSSSLTRTTAGLCVLAWAGPLTAGAQDTYDRSSASSFLDDHCRTCHSGSTPAGGFRTDKLRSEASFVEHPDAWVSLAARVSNHEMPPAGAPSPSLEERTAFVAWVEQTWRSQACAAELPPTPSPIRRLNRDEYSATIRDLFDIQIDVSEMFPVDGAGGEGFDNAAETLFLSPLLAEKYLATAKFVLDVAAKEFKSRAKIFVGRPGPNKTEVEASRQILAEFLPMAFRRPVDSAAIAPYVRLVQRARRRGLDFESAIFFALRSALVSPDFLFHVRADTSAPASGQYALASRLSFFLWGSQPDELLLDIAAAGKMDDPAVLDRLVPRMLRDDRALEFFSRFTEQWLRIRELEGTHGPDPELFPEYAADAELRGDILLQPVFFFREVFRDNRSVLEFLDSDGTVLTQPLITHLGLPLEKEQDRKNPNWMELPEGSGRGGLLGMPSISALASHPHRTSPVLRGVWILDSILGSPPPAPPPDVGELEEPGEGKTVKSIREQLSAHSRSPSCASCHQRIDPLGFALENYDVLGRWRDRDRGVPVDATGRLPDGTQLDGPASLKAALLERKHLFLRNLAKRLLGYALGRGLTASDTCAVESIVTHVESQGYSAWALLREVVRSEPFLHVAGPAQGPERH
ncbi:MAG: DUF1588 domain-containing protein [Acidobacteriia bacterium]|nr:DUF1588 domain-containing protein [Terriglobia bacterium]MYK10940.1 DUF1588 domain-containing protein [Terriglobia bacterium]